MTSKNPPLYTVTQLFNGDVRRQFAHRSLAAATRRVRSLEGAGEGWGIIVTTADLDAPDEVRGFDVYRER